MIIQSSNSCQKQVRSLPFPSPFSSVDFCSFFDKAEPKAGGLQCLIAALFSFLPFIFFPLSILFLVDSGAVLDAAFGISVVGYMGVDLALLGIGEFSLPFLLLSFGE
jgi:hypothetical protein